MALDIRSLEHFVTISESMGFAEAARRLNVSQPSLSRSMTQLEERLGTRLFERGVRGTSITEAGRRFLPHALAILEEVRRAESLFDDDAPHALERVRIEASPNFLHLGLPRLVHDMLAGDAGHAVSIQTATMETALDAVRAHKADIALCILPPYQTRHPDTLQGLVFEELTTMPVSAVAAAGHPIFDAPITIETTSRHGWAVPHQMSISYRFENAFFRRNLPPPAQLLNCASMSLLRHAVVECGLIGLCPLHLVAADLASGTVRTLDLDALHFEHIAVMATAQGGAHPAPAIEAAMAALRQAFASAPA